MEKNEDNMGYVIYNSNLKSYLGRNHIFVLKLHSANIYHDESYGNSVIWELLRDNNADLKPEYLSLKKIEIKIIM